MIREIFNKIDDIMARVEKLPKHSRMAIEALFELFGMIFYTILSHGLIIIGLCVLFVMKFETLFIDVFITYILLVFIVYCLILISKYLNEN